MRKSSIILTIASLVGLTLLPVNIPKTREGSLISNAQPLESIVEKTARAKGHSEQRKELSDLYKSLAKDINTGKPIVAATYLGLWIDGKPPEQNLYWGMHYGHFRMFERAAKDPHIVRNFKHHNWQRVSLEKRSEDPLRIAVYELTVKPNDVWKSYGVTKEFKIYGVFLVYQNLQEAVRDLVLNINGHTNSKINFHDNNQIDLGSDVRLMGYIGHNLYFDTPTTFLDMTKVDSDKEKGVYSIGCITGRDFNHRLSGPNISGMLFTNSNMAPEGYTLLALLDSIAQAHNGRQMVGHANNAYRYFQTLGGQKQPGPLFINQSTGISLK